MTQIDWMLSGATGTSSKTICAVITGRKLSGSFVAVGHHKASVMDAA